MGIQLFLVVLFFIVNLGTTDYASAIPTTDFQGIIGMDRAVNFIPNTKLSDESKKSGFFCDTCLDVSSEVTKILSDSDLSDKIEVFFAQLCQILPSDMESKCVDTAESYIEEIISYLQDLFEEENLCYDTGLCTENAEISQITHASKIQPLLMPLESDTNVCTVCLNATDAFINALDDPEMKIKVIKILFKACQQVENHVQQCQKLVFEYAPIFLSRIEKYMKNGELCTLLQLCSMDSDI